MVLPDFPELSKRAQSRMYDQANRPCRVDGYQEGKMAEVLWTESCKQAEPALTDWIMQFRPIVLPGFPELSKQPRGHIFGEEIAHVGRTDIRRVK